MTTPTPEQMRALADGGEYLASELEGYSWGDLSGHPPAVINDMATALRTTAARLEERCSINGINAHELFSRDDKTTIRDWYRDGVRGASSWTDDEEERHLAGLLEVARNAAEAGYEEAARGRAGLTP